MKTERLPSKVRLLVSKDETYFREGTEWKVSGESQEYWRIGGPQGVACLIPKAQCSAIYDPPKGDKRWQKIPEGGAHLRGPVWAWNTMNKCAVYWDGFTILPAEHFSHWQPAYPPEGPCEPTQEEQDNEEAKKHGPEGSPLWWSYVEGLKRGRETAAQTRQSSGGK